MLGIHQHLDGSLEKFGQSRAQRSIRFFKLPEDFRPVLPVVMVDRLNEKRLLAREGRVKAWRPNPEFAAKHCKRRRLIAVLPEEVESLFEGYIPIEFAWSTANRHFLFGFLRHVLFNSLLDSVAIILYDCFICSDRYINILPTIVSAYESKTCLPEEKAMSETMHAGVDQQRRRIIIHSTIAAGLTTACVAAAQETKPVAPANEPKEVKNMTHKCRITVLRKTLHKDLQEAYLADPKSGVCPFFQEGFC